MKSKDRIARCLIAKIKEDLTIIQHGTTDPSTTDLNTINLPNDCLIYIYDNAIENKVWVKNGDTWINLED